MLPVSDNFTNAEISDVNKPKSKVYLVLGNYANSAFGSTISATSEDTSGDYPASGIIDGDRTEINSGPASSADNDVGQSTWRSELPMELQHQEIVINLGQSRTFNRIKLYHLSESPLSQFKFSYSSDGLSYTDFAGTSGSYSGDNQIETTGGLDVIDTSENITAQYVMLTITETSTPGDQANVVELEIYRKVDVTDRVTGIQIERSRDYQLANALAATATITCENTDQFFCPDYEQSAAQTDFINTELKPGIGIIIELGYEHEGGEETHQNFIGTIDKISIKPRSRQATIEARDIMKSLFNKKVSAKLKESQDIGDLITYMLNLGNVSTFETEVDQTTIVIDYFFTKEENIVDTIRKLVEACGDAQFYIDENGKSIFKIYINTIPRQEVFTSQADWENGTFFNTEATSTPGTIRKRWFLIDDFDDNDETSNPSWVRGTSSLTSGEGWSSSGGRLIYNTYTPILPGIGRARILFGQAYGTWETKIDIQGDNTGKIDFYFVANSIYTVLYDPKRHYGQLTDGYFVRIDRNTNFSFGLYKTSGYSEYLISSNVGPLGDSSTHTLRVTRNTSGFISVYWDGSLVLSNTDNTFTTSVYLAYRVTPVYTGFAETFRFDDLYYSFCIDATTTAAHTDSYYVSNVIDQTNEILEEGVFRARYINPTGCTVTFYTSTSDDGINFDNWIEVDSGDQIPSIAKRYLIFKFVLEAPNDSNILNNLTTPYIQDIIMNWSTGISSVKIPSKISYVLDESLNIDIDQVYADSIGGQTSIINRAVVKAQPLILSGNDSDVQWSATAGTPLEEISASNPIQVTNGDILTYNIVVDNGMDTALMSGTNPAAASVTFGTATGTYIFSRIHPTKPMLQITVTGTGTIEQIKVLGKAFTNDNTFIEKVATNEDSINIYDERRVDISNEWILYDSISQQIADYLVSNFSEPTAYIPEIKIRPTFSIQIGDRVTVSDNSLSIDDDYIVIGVFHNFSTNGNSVDVHTSLKLLRINI